MDINKSFEENIEFMVLRNPKFDKDYIFENESTVENSSFSINKYRVRSLEKRPYLKEVFNSTNSNINISKLINRNNKSVNIQNQKKWDIDERGKQENDLSSDSLWAKKDLKSVVNYRKKAKTSSRKLIRQQIRHDFTPLKDLQSKLISEMPNYAAKARLKDKLKKVGGTVLKTFRALEKLEEDLYKASNSEEHEWKWGSRKYRNEYSHSKNQRDGPSRSRQQTASREPTAQISNVNL